MTVKIDELIGDYKRFNWASIDECNGCSNSRQIKSASNQILMHSIWTLLSLVSGFEDHLRV